jgi:hypothetical protein
MLLYVQTWLPLLMVTLTAATDDAKFTHRLSFAAGNGTKCARIRYRGDEWNRSQSGSSYQRPPGVKPGRPLNYVHR